MCSRTTWVKQGNFKSEDISDEVLNKALEGVEQLHKDGKKVIFMTNGLGEPLLYPNLVKLIKRVKDISYGIKFSFTTNAITLSEKVAKDLIELKVDEMTISLNAGSRDEYKTLMGADAYEKVVDNTLHFLEIRKRLGAKYPVLNIQFMDTKCTTQSLKKGIDFWNKKIEKQDKVFIHEPVTHAGIIDVTGLTDKKDLPGRYPCVQCWTRLAIRTNGDVYPCDAAYYAEGPIPELLLGNVLKKPLKEIYFSKSSKIQEIRANHKTNDYASLASCLKCNTFKLVPNVFFNMPFIGRKDKWF